MRGQRGASPRGARTATPRTSRTLKLFCCCRWGACSHRIGYCMKEENATRDRAVDRPGRSPPASDANPRCPLFPGCAVVRPGLGGWASSLWALTAHALCRAHSIYSKPHITKRVSGDAVGLRLTTYERGFYPLGSVRWYPIRRHAVHPLQVHCKPCGAQESSHDSRHKLQPHSSLGASSRWPSRTSLSHL